MAQRWMIGAVLLGLWALPVWGQQLINGHRTMVGAFNYCEPSGGSDSYACNLAPALPAYIGGACYLFKADVANIGAASLNLNSLGAKTIKKAVGGVTTDLEDDDIRAGQVVAACYDGTNLQMHSLLGNAPTGGGSGTVNAGTEGNFASYATTGTEVSDSGKAVPTGAVVGASDTQTLTNKRVSPRLVTVADATSITCHWDTMDTCDQVNTQAGGTLTISNPSGTCTDGQRLILRIKSTNGHTYSFGSQFRGGTDVPLPGSHAGGSKTEYLGLFCHTGATKIDLLAYTRGY